MHAAYMLDKFLSFVFYSHVLLNIFPFTVLNKVLQMPKRNPVNTSVSMDMVALATKMQLLTFDLLRISEKKTHLFDFSKFIL